MGRRRSLRRRSGRQRRLHALQALADQVLQRVDRLGRIEIEHQPVLVGSTGRRLNT